MSTVNTYSGNLRIFRDGSTIPGGAGKGDIYGAGSLYWGPESCQDRIYIPDEINEDTKVILAINYRMSNTGSNLPSEGIITHYVEQYGPNIILIDPYANIYGDESNDLNETNLNTICNAISDKIKANTGKDVTIVPDVFTGFSLGDEAAIKLGINAAKKENYPPVTIALFDPKVKGAGTPGADHSSGAHQLSLISAEDYASLKNNGATIMGFERLEERGNETMLNNYAIAGKNGVKTMIFYTNNGHNTNDYCKIATDLYGFLSDGDAEAFLNKFEYKEIYDLETGGWRELTANDLINEARNYTTNILGSLDDIENCDNPFIKEQVNIIRSKIRTVNFVTSPLVIETNSTTKIPSEEASLLQKAFDSITSVFAKLEKDTQNIALIGNIYENLDKDLADVAANLNDANTAALAGAAGTAGAIAGADGTGGGNYGGGGGGGGGYYGGGSGGGGATPTTPTPGNNDNKNDDDKTNDDDKNNDKDNEKDDNTDDNINNEDLSSLAEYEEYWPEYDELKTNDEHLVYNCDDEFKLVVHNKGDDVTGLEHYYKFNSPEEALEALDKIKDNYKNIDTLDKILLNNNFVKVLFNKLAFMDLNVIDAQNMYSHLNLVK